MKQEERLARINELDKELYECIVAKTKRLPKKEFWTKHDELNNLTIEYNKENHIYWEQEEWIYETIANLEKNVNMTGYELTDYIANELNKLNGVLVEKEIDYDMTNKMIKDGEEIVEYYSKNYVITINTPIKVYQYLIKRGCQNCCPVEPYKIGGTNWTRNTITPSNDIYEHLAKNSDWYNDNPNIEEFKKKYLPKC